MQSGKFYTGFTSDLKKRLIKHNKGDVPTTSKHLPVQLVYFSAFLTAEKARSFEKYLKSSSGHAFRNKRLI